MKNPPPSSLRQWSANRNRPLFSTRPLSNLSVRLSSSQAVVFLLLLLPFGAVAQKTLTIAAAADLADLETPLASAFRSTDRQVSIVWVTEASGVLSQQIQNGAPYDVFLSANESFITRLASAGKVMPSSVMVYATGRLGVLWKDGKSHPLSDLAQNWVRFLALPNPKLAPYGAAAIQALQHAGLWSKLQDRIVYGENVRQLSRYLKAEMRMPPSPLHPCFRGGIGISFQADGTSRSGSKQRSWPPAPIPNALPSSSRS